MAKMFIEPGQRLFIVEFAIEVGVQTVNRFKTINFFNLCLVCVLAHILLSIVTLLVTNPASFA